MKNKILFFLLLAALQWSCKNEQPEHEEVVRPIRYGEVKIIKTPEKKTFTGTVKSAKEASLGFQVSGTINSIKVGLGERVKAGRLLATLDGMDFQVEQEKSLANVQDRKAQVKTAATKLAASESNYERVEKLYEMNGATLGDYERAKADLEIAESNLQAAKAQLAVTEKQAEIASNKVRYTMLTAPYSGVVTALFHEENELVGNGEPVLILNSENELEVHVRLTELFISHVEHGQQVGIRHPSFQNNELLGTVHEVGYSSEGTSSFPVTILLTGTGKQIRPGSIVDVTFGFDRPNNKQEYLVAPKKGIGGTANQHFAFVLEQSGDVYEARKQPVTVGGHVSGGIEIIEGLKKGDLVATAGLNTLKEGMRVKLLTER